MGTFNTYWLLPSGRDRTGLSGVLERPGVAPPGPAVSEVREAMRNHDSADIESTDTLAPDDAEEICTTADPHTVVLELEKTTKNTYRYAEQTDSTLPVIGTLYVQQWALGEEPPERIEVSISEVRPA